MKYEKRLILTIIVLILFLNIQYASAKTGSIDVSSTPSGASVYLDGVYKGTTPLIMTDVATGSHHLKLTKPDYRDSGSNIVVDYNQTTSVSKTLYFQTGYITINVPSSNLLAKIYIDDIYKETVGITPKTIMNIPIGSHTIKLTQSGYTDSFSTVTVYSYQTTHIDMALSAIKGSIDVSSTPSGASVYLDGVYKGTTPLIMTDVATGSHNVKLTKPDYKDSVSNIIVYYGQTTSVSKTLFVQTGDITINVPSSNLGAKIYIDDIYKESMGITPKTIVNVPIGSHTIKLTQSGRTDSFSTVTVYSDQTTHIDMALSAIKGSIDVSSTPSGASVYLDGVYKGTTPLTMANVATGSHTVKLTKPDYKDSSSAVIVYLGQITSVSKTLSSSLEAAPIEAAPMEAAPIEAAPIEAAPMGAAPIEAAPIEAAPIEAAPMGAAPVEKEFPTNTTIVGGIFASLIIGIIVKKSNNSSKNAMPSRSKNIPINTSSAFGYKGATIQYKIKIKNPTSEPMGDIKVNLYVPDVFLVSEITKTIVMLKPNEGKTVTFEIRPTGECGDCEVSGKVIYYDYSTKKTSEMDIPAKSLSIVCPMLKVKEINESEWHNIVGSLVETEENTREIDMPAETLFVMLSRIVKDMHMYSLKPEITGNQQLFNGVARFYGEGVKELKYAAQIEVVGGAKRSKLILKAWAEREDALTGFYHGILDELEKRVQVKGYINDDIVQNFYHYGDNIGTQVRDSFVYKSNVGNGDVDTCLQCGKERAEGEPFCSGCGIRF